LSTGFKGGKEVKISTQKKKEEDERYISGQGRSHLSRGTCPEGRKKRLTTSRKWQREVYGPRLREGKKKLGTPGGEGPAHGPDSFFKKTILLPRYKKGELPSTEKRGNRTKGQRLTDENRDSLNTYWKGKSANIHL